MDEREADHMGIAKGIRHALGVLPEPNAHLEQLLARIREAEQCAQPAQRQAQGRG